MQEIDLYAHQNVCKMIVGNYFEKDLQKKVDFTTAKVRAVKGGRIETSYCSERYKIGIILFISLYRSLLMDWEFQFWRQM